MAPSMRYLVVRALLFLLPFVVLMVAQVPWWLSLIVSLAFAFAASIVFFPKLRDEAAADLQRMREGRKREGSGPDDADLEDAVLDTEPEQRGGATQPEARADREQPRDATEPEAGATGDGDEPDASARP